MESNNILDEEIDRYLEGSMTPVEKQAFNARMAADSELCREVELQRAIISAVRKERIREIIAKEEAEEVYSAAALRPPDELLKDKINKTYEDIRQKKGIRNLVIYLAPLAAAACIAGFFYIGNLNKCENIANRYYVSYVYTPIPSRGGGYLPMTKSDSIFFNSLDLLENGNIRSAIKQLEDLNNSTSEMIATSSQAVKWYLSLAYLKNGKKGKAKITLLEISGTTSGEFTLKANNLLKELE